MTFKNQVFDEIEAFIEKKLELTSEQFQIALSNINRNNNNEIFIKKSFARQEATLCEALEEIAKLRAVPATEPPTVIESSLVKLLVKEERKQAQPVWCLFSYKISSLLFHISVDDKPVVFPYSYPELYSIQGKSVGYSYENHGVHGDNRDITLWLKIEEIL